MPAQYRIHVSFQSEPACKLQIKSNTPGNTAREKTDERRPPGAVCVTLDDSHDGTSVNLPRGASYGPKCLREVRADLSLYLLYSLMFQAAFLLKLEPVEH